MWPLKIIYCHRLLRKYFSTNCPNFYRMFTKNVKNVIIFQYICRLLDIKNHQLNLKKYIYQATLFLDFLTNYRWHKWSYNYKRLPTMQTTFLLVSSVLMIKNGANEKQKNIKHYIEGYIASNNGLRVILLSDASYKIRVRNTNLTLEVV